MKMTLYAMNNQAAKAVRRGDLATAERWSRLAERHLHMMERETKLAALDLANEAQDIENDRKARLEAERRKRGY